MGKTAVATLLSRATIEYELLVGHFW
jgi:hypothetical protein